MGDQPVPNPLDDLRAASDSVLVTTERLRAVEEERVGLDPEDGRGAELSQEASELAHRLVDVTHAETDMAREVTERT